MRLFIVLISLLYTLPGYSQTVTAKQDRNGVIVNWQDKKLCKYMYIQKKNNRCERSLVYYTPVYSCNGKAIKERKRPRLNFKAEIPAISRMIDTARQFMVIDLCMMNINIKDYDDLLSSLIDKFGASDEWKKSVERRGVYKNDKLNFDYGLVVKMLRDEKILDPMNELLNPYGFSVATAHIVESELQIVSKKDLKRLGKDENLIIPLPGPVWVQLNQMPKK